MKVKILSAVIITGLVCQYCVANPLPEKVIVYVRAFPPEVGLWSAMEEDISGDSVITSNCIAVIDSGVVIPDNYFQEPFILDSSNTSGFIIDPEADSVYVTTLEFWDESVKFGQLGTYPPPIDGHAITQDDYWCPPDPSYIIWVFSFNFAQAFWGHTDVVINEINAHGTWRNNTNFVELYNTSESVISLDGWHLVCDTIYDFPEDAIIPGGGFYVVNEADFPPVFDMDYEADNVYLIDNVSGSDYTGRLVDQVGWSSDHGENVSFLRFSDGDVDTVMCMRDFKGYNDESSYSFEDGFPTRGAPNRHECPGFVVIGARADSVGEGDAFVHWTDPIWEPEFDVSILIKSTEAFPQTPFNGDLVYEGTDQNFLDEFVEPNVVTYYTVFARDHCGQYSTPTEESQASIIMGGVSIDNDPLPVQFTFLTCYPNPFNAQTTISFALENESYVRISIYDITGRLVDILAERSFESGNNSVIWNASDLPSGIYFYSIKTEQNTLTQKAVLLR